MRYQKNSNFWRTIIIKNIKNLNIIKVKKFKKLSNKLSVK